MYVKDETDDVMKIDIEIISKAIADLLSNFKYTYGSIKKTKSEKYLKIFVETGLWSENEKAVKKFNSTKFKGATMKWWLVEYPEEGRYLWDIPLYLVDDEIVNAKI